MSKNNYLSDSKPAFYTDRCEYAFNHPHENSEIQMVMFYRDMTACQLIAGQFRFKIPRKLGLFGSEYDFSNPSHQITIELATLSAGNEIRDQIIPLIKQIGS